MFVQFHSIQHSYVIDMPKECVFWQAIKIVLFVPALSSALSLMVRWYGKVYYLGNLKHFTIKGIFFFRVCAFTFLLFYYYYYCIYNTQLDTHLRLYNLGIYIKYTLHTYIHICIFYVLESIG